MFCTYVGNYMFLMRIAKVFIRTAVEPMELNVCLERDSLYASPEGKETGC